MLNVDKLSSVLPEIQNQIPKNSLSSWEVFNTHKLISSLLNEQVAAYKYFLDEGNNTLYVLWDPRIYSLDIQDIEVLNYAFRNMFSLDTTISVKHYYNDAHYGLIRIQ